MGISSINTMRLILEYSLFLHITLKDSSSGEITSTKEEEWKAFWFKRISSGKLNSVISAPKVYKKEALTVAIAKNNIAFLTGKIIIK